MGSQVKIYRDMTAREIKFAQHILGQHETGNVVLVLAYDGSGYGGPNANMATRQRAASEIFNRPQVQAYIQDGLRKKLAAEALNRDYVTGTLMQCVDTCLSAGTEAHTDQDGTEHAAIPPSASYMATAIRGLELLGKATGGGMFSDRVKHEHEAAIPLPELYAKIGETVAEIRGQHGQALKIPAIIERKIKEHAKSDS